MLRFALAAAFVLFAMSASAQLTTLGVGSSGGSGTPVPMETNDADSMLITDDGVSSVLQ